MRTLPFARMAVISTSSDALKLHMRDAIEHELEKTTPYHPFETRIESWKLPSSLNYLGQHRRKAIEKLHSSG